MSVALTEPIDLRQTAAEGLRVETALSLAQLPRLVELQHVSSGADQPVAITLAVRDDPGSRVVIEGRVRVELVLACRRCLGPVPCELDVPVRLTSGELPEGDFAVDEGPLVLRDLVEDELLLHLSDGAAHEDPSDCDEVASYLVDAPAADMRTPFAGLKDLLDSDLS